MSNKIKDLTYRFRIIYKNGHTVDVAEPVHPRQAHEEVLKQCGLSLQGGSKVKLVRRQEDDAGTYELDAEGKLKYTSDLDY